MYGFAEHIGCPSGPDRSQVPPPLGSHPFMPCSPLTPEMRSFSPFSYDNNHADYDELKSLL